MVGHPARGPVGRAEGTEEQAELSECVSEGVLVIALKFIPR